MMHGQKNIKFIYITININYKGKIIPAQIMKAYGGAEVLFHSF